MKIWLTYIFAVSLILLSACAVGPDRMTQAYRHALETGDAAGLEALSSYKADFAWALKNGLVSDNLQPVKDGESSGSAMVQYGGSSYRLSKIGDTWKIDCSSAGPFNQSTPEMTLLMALHLVNSGRFAELKRLAPPDAAVGELSESAQEIWREFVRSIGNSYDCRPFEISGDSAFLSYGNEELRRVRMQRSGSLWYIVEIN